MEKIILYVSIKDSENADVLNLKFRGVETAEYIYALNDNEFLKLAKSSVEEIKRKSGLLSSAISNIPIRKIDISYELGLNDPRIQRYNVDDGRHILNAFNQVIDKAERRSAAPAIF